MQTLFSTEGIHPRNRFPLWRETLLAHGVAIEWQRLDDAPFEARIKAGRVGPLQLKRILQGAIRGEAMPGLMRRLGNDGNLSVVLKLSGTMTSLQDGRSAVQDAGDLLVLDHRPGVLASTQPGESLSLELPRERLERILGPARLYSALTVGADLASTSLTMTFFRDLVRLSGQLTSDSAQRMAAIGVDLIVASITERMAREVPRSIHGNVTVQRAKAYIEAHLGDPTLDPPGLAAALRVSLRRLQELFHERDRHISDYIWHRRLEAAAARLADPACAHLSIGGLAYGCGFVSQAHFSRRFKARFGLSPGGYRQAHMSATRAEAR